MPIELQRVIDCCRAERNLSLLKARLIKSTTPGRKKDATPHRSATSEAQLDLSLLEESLTKTVWERMQANDDALRLADLLNTAMLKTRAKP